MTERMNTRGRRDPKKTVDKRITPGFEAQSGKGRPKGVQNKLTGQVKEMILAALDKAGGVDYLAGQAEANPAAFISLVGKVLPLTLQGNPDQPIAIQRIDEDADAFMRGAASLAARLRAAGVSGGTVQ